MASAGSRRRARIGTVWVRPEASGQASLAGATSGHSAAASVVLIYDSLKDRKSAFPVTCCVRVEWQGVWASCVPGMGSAIRRLLRALSLHNMRSETNPNGLASSNRACGLALRDWNVARAQAIKWQSMGDQDRIVIKAAAFAH